MSLFLCIKQFNSRLGDELNLKVGDKIEVLADDNEYNDGWYMGKNLNTGEVGLYPKSFTQELMEDDVPKPSMLRSRSRRLASLNSQGQSSPMQSPITHSPVVNDASSNKDVNRTMSDIDKALEELQIDTTKSPMNKSTIFSKISQYNEVEPPQTKEITKESPELVSAPKPISNGNHSKPSSPVPMVGANSLANSHSLSVNTSGPNPNDAINWTPNEVSHYFNSKGFESSVCNKFIQHKITGEILFELDLAHLKELEIDSFGTRFEIHKQIEILKKAASEKGLPETPVTQNSGPFTPTHDAGFFKEAVEQNGSLEDVPNFKFGDKESRLAEKETKLPDRGLNDKEKQPSQNRPVSSIYDSVHSRSQSKDDYYHRRNSSVLSNNFDYTQNQKTKEHRRHSSMFSWKDQDVQDKLISPAKLRKPATTDIDTTQLSPQQERFSNKDTPNISSNSSNDYNTSKDVSSDSDTSTPNVTPISQQPSRFKTLRTASTSNFKNLTGSKKLKTSAFQEGIRNITPDEAIKSASYSGFMSKKSGNNLSWRSRYFTLHGTRLSYFTSLKDKKERGLIDITAHKVIPISTDGEDKYIALYAASTGVGRYCFKIIPPAPGFKKGLTFTQPKVHYFAVETQEEMRAWMKALMTSTIDIDDSVPVVSSCSTPTVTLAKAQELLAKAREETKLKDEQNRNKDYENEFNNGDQYSESHLNNFIGNYTLDPNTSEENSQLADDSLEHKTNGPKKLTVDTREPTTPSTTTTNQTGFASPYLLASGLLSPKDKDRELPLPTSRNGSVNGHPAPMVSPVTNSPVATHSPVTHAAHSPVAHSPATHSTATHVGNGYGNSNMSTPKESSRDYFPSQESTPKSQFSNGKQKKKRNSDKLMAYSSDGSGNHTFFIKQKK